MINKCKSCKILGDWNKFYVSEFSIEIDSWAKLSSFRTKADSFMMKWNVKTQTHFFFLFGWKIPNANYITLSTFLYDFEVANDLDALDIEWERKKYDDKPLFMETHNEYQ